MGNDKPSYLAAMLTSQANLYAVLGVGAVAALAAIPFGLIGAAVPLIALATGEALAALVVPDMSTFRAKVDERLRKSQRASARESILLEMAKRIPIQFQGRTIAPARNERLSQENKSRMRGYNTMVEQIGSLAQVAQDRKSALGDREVERMYEASIDYLSLWLARLVIDAREGNIDIREVHSKMREIESKIPSSTPKVASQLRHAHKEYAAIVARRNSLEGKSASIDAALAAMPDKIEEIYQMVIASPYSIGMGDKLEGSLSRLRIAEELEQELSLDLSTELPDMSFVHTAAPPAVSKTSKARAASKQSTLN